MRLTDPIKAKQLAKALSDLAEEGVAQVFRPSLGADWLVGVVGPLQLDVLSSRLDTEYGVPVRFEDAGFQAARWIGSKSDVELKRFLARPALGARLGRRRLPGLPRPRPVVFWHAAQGLARNRLRDDAGTGVSRATAHASRPALRGIGGRGTIEAVEWRSQSPAHVAAPSTVLRDGPRIPALRGRGSAELRIPKSRFPFASAASFWHRTATFRAGDPGCAPCACPKSPQNQRTRT